MATIDSEAKKQPEKWNWQSGNNTAFYGTGDTDSTAVGVEPMQPAAEEAAEMAGQNGDGFGNKPLTPDMQAKLQQVLNIAALADQKGIPHQIDVNLVTQALNSGMVSDAAAPQLAMQETEAAGTEGRVMTASLADAAGGLSAVALAVGGHFVPGEMGTGALAAAAVSGKALFSQMLGTTDNGKVNNDSLGADPKEEEQENKSLTVANVSIANLMTDMPKNLEVPNLNPQGIGKGMV